MVVIDINNHVVVLVVLVVQVVPSMLLVNHVQFSPWQAVIVLAVPYLPAA